MNTHTHIHTYIYMYIECTCIFLPNFPNYITHERVDHNL